MKELSEKNLTLYTGFKITSADTDMYTRIRAGALLNLLIQSAINSAESLGFGFAEGTETFLGAQPSYSRDIPSTEMEPGSRSGNVAKIN